MKQITLIKTGGTIPAIKSEHGDFEDWFSAGLGVASVQQIDVYKNQSLPELTDTHCVVITGSAAMVSHREEWSENTAQWLKQVVGKGLPVLGICYGHQLLAHALGGKVGLNPNGRQIGTVSTTALNAALDDPLLGHLPNQYASQASHSESVLELPPNAVRLATSALDDNFAIRFAPNAWGVQYHPEFSATVMTDYINYRSDALLEEGLNPQGLLMGITETDRAQSVLRKFGELFAGA